jgi:hypothetical protein
VKDAERVTERLRRGFAAADETEQAAGGVCPPAERIWEGVHGRLTADDTKRLALHLAECPSCSTDWRLAMRSPERTAAANRVARPLRPRLRWAVAAAAVVVVAGFVAVLQNTDIVRPTGTPYRGTDEESIRSVVPDDAVLPRENAVLRWTTAGEDASYSVEVYLQDLTTLASAHGLRETEFRIPPTALDAVEPGGTVAWQVEARLPDGRRIESKAFLVRIE